MMSDKACCVIGFKMAIIAAGSQAMRLPFMPEDPRVVDSTGALALKEVPKRVAHYLWTVLIARSCEVFPLLCPMSGGQMCIIAFITHSSDIRQILNHIGVESESPHISPAPGPPLWDDCDAQMDDGVHIEPDRDLAAQPVPDFEVDQRVNW